MTMVSSGAINLGGNTVTVPGRVTSSAEFELYENGKGYDSSGTSTISLADSAVRTLAGVASGAISFSDLYGKTAFTPGSQAFTANGTYTVPFGYSSITIEVWGAGGGGAAWDTTGMPMCGCCGYHDYSYGGAAGGYAKTTTTTLSAGTVLTITVGTGGAGGSSLGSAGSAGGNGRVIITYS